MSHWSVDYLWAQSETRDELLCSKPWALVCEQVCITLVLHRSGGHSLRYCLQAMKVYGSEDTVAASRETELLVFVWRGLAFLDQEPSSSFA